MNALTVSDIAAYLGNPSTTVSPDTRVNTAPTFHSVLADCWSTPQVLNSFIREYSSKGNIADHMSTSAIVENTSGKCRLLYTANKALAHDAVSMKSLSRPTALAPSFLLPVAYRAEYSGSDLAAVSSEKHTAELELRGAGAEISVTSFSRGSGPQRWVMSLRSIARGWADLRDYGVWRCLVRNENPYLLGGYSETHFSYSQKLRNVLSHVGAANRGPVYVSSCIDACNNMLLSSGMSLDRGVVHQSVISRLQSLPSGQTADASFSTDEVSRAQRRGPFSDTITLGGVTLKGSYFANPQQLSGMGGVNMMATDCHIPSFTLLLPGQSSVLKPSIQSSRGKLLTIEDAVKKSGLAEFLYAKKDTLEGGTKSIEDMIMGLNYGDTDCIKPPRVPGPKRTDDGDNYRARLERSLFGLPMAAGTEPVLHPLDDASNPFEPMTGMRFGTGPSSTLESSEAERESSEEPGASGGTGAGGRMVLETGRSTDVSKDSSKEAFESAVITAAMEGTLPVVFAFVNWGCTYVAQPVCLSSGKSVYDLHSSGDAMLERRASNQTVLFTHSMATAAIIAQRDAAMTIPSFAISGYKWGDSDKIRSKGGDFGEDDVSEHGSLAVHALPYTRRSGKEDTCFLLGKTPEFLKENSNVLDPNSNEETVYWGNQDGGNEPWAVELAKLQNYSLENFDRNPLKHESKGLSPCALKGTSYDLDIKTGRHTIRQQGCDTFCDLAGSNTLDWRTGKKGVWDEAPDTVRDLWGKC